MKQKFILWVEDYLFFPNTFQKIISFLLLPLTLIYLLVILIKRALAKPLEFDIPVISIGNLIIGGSGKTPLTIALARDKKDACIVLRGYARESKGLYVVSNKGEILTDVKTSGDEAMLLAKSLKNSSVIVSENRIQGIKKAIEMGCKIVFLDDAFSKYEIKKFDILIRPKVEPTNIFCIPSGGYREPKMFYSLANIEIKESVGYKRYVTYTLNDKQVEKLPEKTILLTAISKPKRLLEYLPKGIKMIAFEDHHIFTKDEIDEIISNNKDYFIITTLKDYVKLKEFDLKNIYLMNLDIKIDFDKVDFTKMDNYINSFK